MKVINLKDYGVVVINSKLTKEAILKLAKHAPEALSLKDNEGNEVFKIGFGASASISKYGIMFDKEDSEGKALISMNETLENAEVAEKYAATLMNLKAIETNAEAVYTQLEEMLMEVENSIENPLETAEVVAEEGGAE